MTVYQQVIELLKGKQDQEVKLSWVKEQLHAKYGTNPGSVILSDYCYNRINNGISFEKHIFEFLGGGFYKYLGEDYPYTGMIIHKPLGSKVVYIKGEWKHGTQVYYDEPVIRK